MTRACMIPRIAVVTACAWGTGASASTLHVPSDFPTIQAGIDAAVAGDVVLVAPGIYADFEVRDMEGFPRAAVAFLKDGVTLKSESGPGSTVIDVGAVTGPEAAGAIGYFLGSGPTRLQGFTFKGGASPAVGVVLAHCGDAQVNDCAFEDLFSTSQLGAGARLNGDISLSNCTFLRCSAPSYGALYHLDGFIDMTACIVKECDDGAVGCTYFQAGPCTQTFIACEFLDNIGGGLSIERACSATVRECRFERNFSTRYDRGALAVVVGPATIDKCVFIDNGTSEPYVGSAINAGGVCTIRGNTLLRNYGNQAHWDRTGVITLGNAATTVENNIVMGSYGAVALSANLLIPRSCNVYFLNWGLGIPLAPMDRMVNPEFCDPDNNDITLKSSSPCLPGDPFGCGLVGAFELGCGTVSVESSSWGAIKGLYR